MLADLKTECYNKKMLDTEDPSLFMALVERMRIKLGVKGYKIDDESLM